MKKILIITTLLILPQISHSADWSSCEYELSRVSREAKNTEYIASELSSMQSELESLKDEYESCVQFPDIYDLMRDGCQSQLNDYNWKVDEYNSKVSELSNEFDTMVRKVKNSISYCGF